MADCDEIPSLRGVAYPWPGVIALTALNCAVWFTLAHDPDLLLRIPFVSDHAEGWRAVTLPLLIVEYAVICYWLESTTLRAMIRDLRLVPAPDTLRRKLAFHRLSFLQVAVIFLPLVLTAISVSGSVRIPTMGFLQFIIALCINFLLCGLEEEGLNLRWSLKTTGIMLEVILWLMLIHFAWSSA